VPQGAIYCWTLGWYLSPHEVAIRFGHKDVYDLLCDRSTAKVRLLVACSRADAETARSILRERPGLIAEFTAADQALMPFSMFYGRPDAVKLMLSLGFDPSIAGIDGGTLLHIAAWMGEIEIVRALLQDHRARIDLEARDSTHGSTPLGWAAHGSVHSPAKNRGSHAEVVSALVAAGAAVDSPANKYGTSLIDQCRGNNPLQELLRKLGAK
jgi:ankyrin repeat protein